MRSYANLFAPQRPELTAAWESAVHNQKRAEAAEAKLVQIERAIPDTFYAGADPAHRIEQLVRIWQNAVKANAELEAEGAQLCEQFLAENRDALEQEARAKKAEAEVERLRAEQALQRAKLKEKGLAFNETLLMQGQEITRLRALIACALEIITRHKASLCDPCTCEADVLAALRGEGEK